MYRARIKPIKRINELFLLLTIYSFVKENGTPPSADNLMLLKDEFSSTLIRVDTLRMWLKRHTGRVIRRVGDFRPYRYELNRQGNKRVRYLVKRYFTSEIQGQKFDLLYSLKVAQIYFKARDFFSDPWEYNELFDILLEYLKT